MSLRERVVPDYERSFGFVPEGLERRLRVFEPLDPEAIEAIETVRRRGTLPHALDPKIAQLVTIAVLLAQRDPGARNHAIAARRLGASDAELAEVALLAGLNAGLGALNLGAEIIEATAQPPL